MARDFSLELSPVRGKVQTKIKDMLTEYLSGNRTSLALVGEKGSGKTYLLQHYIKSLRDNDNVTCLYINAGTISNTMHFFYELCNQLDYSPSSYKEWEAYANEMFNYVMISAGKYVLAVDDVHIMAGKDEKLLSYLRGKYQEMDNLFLFFTLDSEYEVNVFSYDKPFYGQLEIIYLKPLLKDESLEFIQWIAPDANMQDLAIKTVTQYGGGNPQHLKMLYYLALGAGAAKPGNLPEMENVLKEYMESAIISPLSPQLRAILKVLAGNEPKRVTDLSEQLKTKTGAIVSQLKRLIQKGLVEKATIGGSTQYKLKSHIQLLFNEDEAFH